MDQKSHHCDEQLVEIFLKFSVIQQAMNERHRKGWNINDKINTFLWHVKGKTKLTRWGLNTLLIKIAYPPILAIIALQLPLGSWGGLSSEMEVQNVKTKQALPGRLISTCGMRGCVAAVHSLGCAAWIEHSQQLPQGNGEAVLAPSLPPHRSYP